MMRDFDPDTLRQKAKEFLLSRAHRKSDAMPCSEGQRSLWYLHQMAPESAAYNVGYAIEIEGPIDHKIIRKCCRDIVKRHAELQSVFSSTSGSLLKRIEVGERLDFKQIPVGIVSDREIRDIVIKEYKRPFDLSCGPLIRFVAFDLKNGNHIFLLVAHHIVCDGDSLWLLLDELGDQYSQTVGGGGESVVTIDSSYDEFVASEQALINSGSLSPSWEYWRSKLEAAPNPIDLTLANPRPNSQKLTGLSRPLRMRKELTGEIRARAREIGVTPYAFLLAAFQVLISRYGRENDIIVGVPSSLTRAGSYQQVVGHFVNQLPIRSVLTGNMNFRTLVEEVFDQLLSAREHGNVPFGEMVKRFCPVRTPNRSPILQSSFVLQKSPKSNSIFDLTVPEGERRWGQWGGLKVSHFDFAQQEGQLDITLELIDGVDEFFGRVKTDDHLFSAEDTEQLASSFVALVTHAAKNPACNIEDLKIQNDDDRDMMLSVSGNLCRKFPVVINLAQAFSEAVNRYPTRIAVKFDDSKLTYAELDARANELADYIVAQGMHQSRIGLCVDRSLDMIIGILGILKAGCAYIPIDPNSPSARQQFIAQDSGVELLLTQSHLRDRIQGLNLSTLCLDADWDMIANQKGKVLQIEAVSPDSEAYVIYTSGTTGQPKGVVISHKNVIRLFRTTNDYYGFNEQDIWPLLHSFAFDVSVWEIWGAFLYGGTLIVVSHDIIRSPNELTELLIAEKATILNQTPSAFRLLMKADNLSDLASNGKLRLISFAGEALEPQNLKQWVDLAGDENPKIVNMYGITETTVHAMYRRIFKQDLLSHSSMIGEPFPDLRIYILDERMEPVPYGVQGEIYVGGDGVGIGYHNRKDLNEQRFITDPFKREANGRLYRSGDLAIRRRNGDIEYCGRMDRQVKIRGFRIELSEIEYTLSEHSMLNAVIVRVLGSGETSTIVAYVVKRDSKNADLTSRELQRFLYKKLPDYMVPSLFVFLDSFPLNANGKIDDAKLPLPLLDKKFETSSFVPPRDNVERNLIRIWQKILKCEGVGIEDNFFDLGGHSFVAVAMVAAIETAFGVKIPVSSVLYNQTITKIAELVRASTNSVTNSPLVAIKEGSGDRNIFCVAGGGGNVVYYYHLASHLSNEIGFYGLQAFGLDGSEPKTNVVDAAKAYIDHIKSIQPLGPYLLAGHCFGAWIAYEIANQLVLSGEQVERLFVIDAPAPTTELAQHKNLYDRSDPAWVTKFVKAFSEGININIEHKTNDSEKTQTELLNDVAIHFENAGLLPIDAGRKQIHALFDVFVNNNLAVYSPAEGHLLAITLFKANEFHSDYDYSMVEDETKSFSWAKFARPPINVHVVPGNHITMLNDENVSEISDLISKSITGGVSSNDQYSVR